MQRGSEVKGSKTVSDNPGSFDLERNLQNSRDIEKSRSQGTILVCFEVYPGITTHVQDVHLTE